MDSCESHTCVIKSLCHRLSELDAQTMARLKMALTRGRHCFLLSQSIFYYKNARSTTTHWLPLSSSPCGSSSDILRQYLTCVLDIAYLFTAFIRTSFLYHVVSPCHLFLLMTRMICVVIIIIDCSQSILQRDK